MNGRVGALLAAYAAFCSLYTSSKSSNNYPKDKYEKIHDEIKQIKGISAKEMGTSGKKKKSRAQRKRENSRRKK